MISIQQKLKMTLEEFIFWKNFCQIFQEPALINQVIANNKTQIHKYMNSPSLNIRNHPHQHQESKNPSKDEENGTKSPGTKATDLKKIQQTVSLTKNRVALLKQQLKREKNAIKKNQSLTEEVISKKLKVNEANRFKQKDNSNEQIRIKQLRRRNRSMRLEHERSLENIQKAIYLVKLDDAKELKKISEEHKRKMREMEEDHENSALEKKRKIKEAKAKAKEKEMGFWKEKLTSVYAEQAMNAYQAEKQKQQKMKEIKQLEQEEIKLLEMINKQHAKSIDTKKQYVAALSLSAKAVAEAVGSSYQNKKSRIGSERGSRISKSVMQLHEEEPSHEKKNIKSRYMEAPHNFGPKIKMPHAQVNQDKFKIILQELKKLDKKNLKQPVTDRRIKEVDNEDEDEMQ